MDHPTDLPSLETHRLCRGCRQWLLPMYGSDQKEAPQGMLSPRSVRLAVEDAAGVDRSFFVCFECQARSRRRRWIVFGGLAALIGLALLARELLGG